MPVDPTVAEAYDDVRNDSTETNWLVLDYDADDIIQVLATGEDFNEFKEQLIGASRSYGYLRMVTGDDMSKRAKFAFITWVHPNCSPIKRAKVSTDKADVKKIIRVFTSEMLFQDSDDVTEELILRS